MDCSLFVYTYRVSIPQVSTGFAFPPLFVFSFTFLLLSQDQVMGQPVTWVAPHMFTTHYPHDVDFSIMLTFLEFHETLLKFAMFKLFHSLDLRYPGEAWVCALAVDQSWRRARVVVFTAVFTCHY